MISPHRAALAWLRRRLMRLLEREMRREPLDIERLGNVIMHLDERIVVLNILIDLGGDQVRSFTFSRPGWGCEVRRGTPEQEAHSDADQERLLDAANAALADLERLRGRG